MDYTLSSSMNWMQYVNREVLLGEVPELEIVSSISYYPR